jgi:hypothetical protein
MEALLLRYVFAAHTVPGDIITNPRVDDRENVHAPEEQRRFLILRRKN